jgi:hypothetical protein
MTDDRRTTDWGVEEPVDDVVEQHQEAVPEPEEERGPDLPEEVPLEADPADAAEQAREVETDDEDYR